MKKGILLLIAFIGFGISLQAQVMSNKEAKKVTQEINKSIDQLEKTVEKADWKKIQKVVDRTTKDLNKNADQVLEIVEDLDFSKLASIIIKVGSELEQNIDTKQFQKTIEEIGVKLDKALSQKASEVK